MSSLTEALGAIGFPDGGAVVRDDRQSAFVLDLLPYFFAVVSRKYAGANTFRAGRMDDLRAHPTVKPVAIVADAIKDCTQRNQIVIDTFQWLRHNAACGRTGRPQARAMEIDPRYVDVAIRRWQAFTGRDAIHIDTGLTFEEVASDRRDRPLPAPTVARGGDDDGTQKQKRRAPRRSIQRL